MQFCNDVTDHSYSVFVALMPSCDFIAIFINGDKHCYTSRVNISQPCSEVITLQNGQNMVSFTTR